MLRMLDEYLSDLKKEFSGYGKSTLTADLLAGTTVAAVALPLALAFGVSSGADAAAGLITAIVSAFLIGALSGASYQISGPTGAMSAILIPLSLRLGLPAMLLAGAMAGVILILAGLFRAGRLASFLPRSVITGFTSGIAIIIALGQVENFTGVKSHGDESWLRVINIFKDGFSPNLYAVSIGLFVVVLMLAWPKKWGARFPASLAAVVLVTAVQMIFALPVDTVGGIPRTLVHDTRLSVSAIFSIPFNEVIMPAISIAALCMIESLLCGAAAGKMCSKRLRGDRELLAQGLGNLLLPLFGGVPATAAIARTSVAIKSGGKTRLTGIFQGVVLLLSMFLLTPFMSNIPMAALAGVLMVTAWRMNERESIRYIFKNKFKGSIVKFAVTLACTVVFDLTIAIAVGCLLSMLLFVVRESDLEVTVSEFDPERVHKDIKLLQHVQVVYITGSVFFGSSEAFAEKIREATGSALILSMRGVPHVDTSGVQEILDFCQEKKNAGVTLLFCSVQPHVKAYFDRSGVTALAGGPGVFFPMAEDALGSLHNRV